MRKWWVAMFFRFICTTSIFGQEGAATVATTVRLDTTPPDAPFKIVEVMLNGKAAEPGMLFQAGDDWFNQIRAVIKNMFHHNCRDWHSHPLPR